MSDKQRVDNWDSTVLPISKLKRKDIGLFYPKPYNATTLEAAPQPIGLPFFLLLNQI